MRSGNGLEMKRKRSPALCWQLCSSLCLCVSLWLQCCGTARCAPRLATATSSALAGVPLPQLRRAMPLAVPQSDKQTKEEGVDRNGNEKASSKEERCDFDCILPIAVPLPLLAVHSSPRASHCCRRSRLLRLLAHAIATSGQQHRHGALPTRACQVLHGCAVRLNQSGPIGDRCGSQSGSEQTKFD